jgi:selenium metabolism protein YedF
MMTTVDYRNLSCPAPVVETRKQLLAHPDAPLTVLVGDSIARDNVLRLAQTLGFGTSAEAADGGFRLQLTPDGAVCPAPTAAAPGAGKTVVYLGNDSMGGDSRELGQMLMVAFVTTLLELDPLPDTILCINEGVRLSTEGSRLREPLQRLAERGVEVISCGLCLDYFQLKDKLVVGRVGNMLETVQAFASAGRLIRP